MKRTKRLLSTLLALCMVLAMLPATALAAPATPDPDPAPADPKDRYTVLVLDCSGSMRGDPIDELRKAASKFCTSVFADEATSGVKNHVAIVSFDSYAYVECNFTNSNSLADLQTAIDKLDDRGTTNIADALEKAVGLLAPIEVSDPTAIKNILLLTDGVPVQDKTDPDGPYTDWEANYCYNWSKSANMWGRFNVYTFGFFHSMSEYTKKFCREFLSDLAGARDNGTGRFYEIGNSADLEYVFGSLVAEDITDIDTDNITVDFMTPFNPTTNTGNTLVIQIRCPVDVTVSYKGTKILDSTPGDVQILKSNLGMMVISEENEEKTDSVKTIYLNGAPSRWERYGIQVKPNETVTDKCKIFVNYAVCSSIAGTADAPIAPTEWTYTERTVRRGDVISVIPHKTPAEGELITVTNPADAYDPNNDPQELETNPHFTFVPTVTGGTVVLSKRNAEPGDWVNVYVTPDEGYELQSITVTDLRGWPVTLREMGENAYSFTMPNARINVNPVFVKVAEDDDPYSTNVPATVPNVTGSSPSYGAMVINPGPMTYSDVNAGDWFYDNVKFCHERYLLNKTGEADGKFEPNTSASRAAIWVALSRLAGRNTITQGDNWYDRAMIWAKGKGITDGENAMGELTREQFVTMLWRYDGNKYVNTDNLGQFTDGTSVSWWASEAVKWAVANGLLNGSYGQLNPQGNVTRAEVAAVLQRYVQNIH